MNSLWAAVVAVAFAAQPPFKTAHGARNVVLNLIIEQPEYPFVAGCTAASTTTEMNPVYRPYAGLASLPVAASFDSVAAAHTTSLINRLKNRQGSSDDYVDCAVLTSARDFKRGASFSFGASMCECGAADLPKDMCRATKRFIEAFSCLDHTVPPQYCSSKQGPWFGATESSNCKKPSTGGLSPFALELFDLRYFSATPAEIPESVVASEGPTYYWINKSIERLMRFRDFEIHCAAGVYDEIEHILPGWRPVKNFYYQHPRMQHPIFLTSLFGLDEQTYMLLLPEAQTDFEGYLRVATQQSWSMLETVEGKVHTGAAGAANSLAPEVANFLVEKFLAVDLGIGNVADVPKLIVAGRGAWGGPAAHVIARRVFDVLASKGLGGVRVDLVTFNSARAGNGEFMGGLARDVNVRSIVATAGTASEFVCEAQRTCTEISGAMRTGLGNGNIDDYANLVGRVTATPADLAVASRRPAWAELQAAKQTAAFDTCGLDCFLAAKFCGDDDEVCDPERCSLWI